MDQRSLYLVWHEIDEGDPIFIGFFNTHKSASDYIQSLNPHSLFVNGLHPSNFRINTIPYIGSS